VISRQSTGVDGSKAFSGINHGKSDEGRSRRNILSLANENDSHSLGKPPDNSWKLKSAMILENSLRETRTSSFHSPNVPKLPTEKRIIIIIECKCSG
jgi:hypothetical protein